MKNLALWDILTGIMLLGVVCLACGFGVVLFSPGEFSPFPVPPTLTQVVIVIPTSTTAPRVLPPTWTPEQPGAEATQPPRATATLRPSSTPIMTNTPYIAPTATPLPTFTPLPSATRADASCYVVAESPVDDTEFQPNQVFTKRWTIRNNSNKTWPASNSDIKFSSGTRMQTGADVYDLPHDVPHNGLVDVTVNMRAPSAANTYTGNWVITSDDGDVCRFFVKIVVK